MRTEQKKTAERKKNHFLLVTFQEEIKWKRKCVER